MSTRPSTRRARRALHREMLERLEGRLLLASIDWVNRLVADNFNLYGVNQNVARAIVDRAIGDWERVIASFNYSGGNTAFQLTLRAESGFPGSANITDVDAQGKPRAATVRLDDFGGGGQPWYFDQIPGTFTLPDDAEFDDFVAPFNNDGGPQNGLDFYTVALHEIGHALGVASTDSDPGATLAVNSFINFNGWVIDPNNPGDGCPPNDPTCNDPGNHVFPVNFNGGAVDYAMTNAGGPGHPNTAPSHLYEGPAVGGFPVHPNELLNDGRTFNGNFNQRLLISDTTAGFLRDIYGYTVNLPSQINTFYANFNTTTGELFVEGDLGNADDFIALTIVGTDLRVQVNGTSELIPIAPLNSITVSAGGGNDTINVFGIPAGVIATIAGSSGNDTISIGNGDIDNEIRGAVIVLSGSGTDALRIFDQNDAGADGYVISATAVAKPGTLFGGLSYAGDSEILVITANDVANVIQIESLHQNVSLTVNARDGSDQIVVGGQSATIGGAVNGNVTINAGTLGDDLVIFDDSNGSGQDIYALNGGNFQQTDTEIFTFNDAERVELRANNEASGIAVANTFGYELTIEGNGGADLIDFGFGILAATGDATIFGGEGADVLRLNDTNTFAPTTYTVNQTTGLPFVELFNASQIVIYDSISDLILDGGPFDDSMTSFAVPSLTTLRMNGNGGDDFIAVQGHPTQNPALLPRVTVTGGAGSDNVEVNTDGQGGARAEFIESETLERLALGTSGRLRLAEGGNVIDVLSSVSMPPNGSELDLTDGYFVRRGNASFPFYRDRLAVGYNAGAWNGLGINSSYAAASANSDGLGIARASELFNGGGGVVAGINLAAGDILIRHTLYGDANLDGTVNLPDFNRLAANFGGTGTTWAQGNFNYDNTTNLPDFNLQAGNFGMSAAPDALRVGRSLDADELLKMLEEGHGRQGGRDRVK